MISQKKKWMTECYTDKGLDEGPTLYEKSLSELYPQAQKQEQWLKSWPPEVNSKAPIDVIRAFHPKFMKS